MSDKVYEFNTSNAVGQIGEIAIIKWLENNPKVESVEDVTNDKFFQNLDIDLLVHNVDKRDYSVEIKTDTYVSGNFFFEVISNEEYQTEGCLMKSQANYLFYFFLKTKILYIINLDKFRKFVLENQDRWQERQVKNRSFTSRRYLVPIDVVMSELKAIKKVQM